MSLEPKLLRARQASVYLGIALSTFWRWTAQGVLPPGTKLSTRCTVWRTSDLDLFLASKGLPNE